MNAYPKIMAFGKPEVRDVFDGPVEVTEKVDGSQFGFGIFDGQLVMRSKGAVLYQGSIPSLFKPAVLHVLSVEERMERDVFFWGETLCKPKHNTLKYDRVPLNHIALFGGVIDGVHLQWDDLAWWADKLEVDVVPKFNVSWSNDWPSTLRGLLEEESFLGGCKVEGVVVKNYNKNWLLGGSVVPLMAAKYVSEAFKEVHQKNWKSENTHKGRYEVFKDGFATPARWEKAIQRMRESGSLDDSPKDIGPLMAEIRKDVATEEKSSIMEFLWSEFGKDVVNASVKGFAEWYKQRLLDQTFSVQ